ncbi:26S proteasome non-ATPase regulatory subunit [Acrasis kona]|uniref:26S proteasome non-ATPase regulatory subunit n=1 Tax=Acrasis kona TaxID=1008807 RepID=A0AAW2ZB09_9EUKA
MNIHHNDGDVQLTHEQISQFFDHIKSGNLYAVKDAVCMNRAYLYCRTEDEWEYTGLHWASQKGYPEIVSYLLSQGADYHLEARKVPWKPILLASRYGHKSIVELFLDAGEDVDVQINCDSKYTPLHYACHHGHVDIVKLLLDRRTSISLVSGHGLRPIHTAANNGQAACVGLLLEYAEEIDVVHNSEWRYTPLHWACQEGKSEVVKLLLDHNANIHIKCGKTSQTALQIAQKNSFTEIVGLLQRHELKELQNKNYNVLLEVGGTKKRIVHARNICTLADLKRFLYHQLSLTGSMERYLYEWFVQEFDDYAVVDQLDHLPTNVKIKVTLEGNAPAPTGSDSFQNQSIIEDGSLNLLKLLGMGTNGTVYLAQHIDSEQQLALKKIPCINHVEAKQKLQEYSQLKGLDHDYLTCYQNINAKRVQLLEDIFITTEYYDKGDFSTFISARRQLEVPLSIHIILEYMKQITSAICYLHERGIMHGDLKPQNIFFASDFKNLKITDYGLHRSSKCFSTTMSSMRYLSPEVIANGTYHMGSDLWSMGCIFAEMLLLDSKVYYMDVYIHQDFHSNLCQEICKKYPSELADIVCSLLNTNVQDRPEAKSVLKSITQIQKNY